MEQNHKHTPRPDGEKKALISRLHRIQGQLTGIERMIENDQYCGDILIQTSAAQKALQSVSQMILDTHMKTCVKEQILDGNDQVIDELSDLIRKLK